MIRYILERNEDHILKTNTTMGNHDHFFRATRPCCIKTPKSNRTVTQVFVSVSTKVDRIMLSF